MQKRISLSQIEYMIKEKKYILEKLEMMKKSLIEEIQDEKHIIESVAYKKPNINLLNDNVKEKNFSDLYDTVEKYRSVARKINSDLLLQLNQTIEETETVSRVWACFMAIRSSGKYFDVLYEYLVMNVPIISIALKYDRSVGTIRSWKKKSLSMISKLYERGDISSEMLEHFTSNTAEEIFGD